jgi:anti-sigma B factor antagonist
MDEEPFDLRVMHVDGDVVLSVDDDIDLASAPTLTAGLRRLTVPSNVVMDMEHVAFIDSAGLRVLITETLRLRAAGGSLKLRKLSAGIRRLIEVTGVEEILVATE